MMALSAFRRMLLYASLCLVLSANAATRYVTNLLDNGSPGTLRQTIASANSGDTILFAVSGTIFLEATNGELVIDKTLAINGEDNIIIDGQNNIATSLHIVAGGGNTQLESLTIQNFSDSGGSEGVNVYGIFIDVGAPGCTINNCIIKKLLSTGSDNCFVYGIRANSELSALNNNTITELQRGDGDDYVAGGVIAILAEVQGACTHNTVSYCAAKDTGGSGGFLSLMSIDVIDGEFSHNTIAHCTTGSAYQSGRIRAMLLSLKNSTCCHNIVFDCATGTSSTLSGDIIGIEAEAVDSSFSNNAVYDCVTGNSIDGSSGSLLGILLQTSSTANKHLFTYNSVTNCSTGQSNAVSGSVFGMRVTISTLVKNALCSNNIVSQCSTGDSSTSSGFIDAVMVITDSQEVLFSNNKVDTCLTGNGNQNSGKINAIEIRAATLSCFNNEIHSVMSGIAGQTSGSVFGLQLFVESAICSGNAVDNLRSGVALTSGGVGGLLFALGVGSFERAPSLLINNHIATIISGQAIARGSARGMLVENIGDGSQVSCNTIRLISGGENPSLVIDNTVGLRIDEGNQLSIKGNSISEVIGEHCQFTTGMQFGRTDRERVTTSVTNLTISQNTVKNISDTTSGFGITVLGENSNGNSILSNSISGTTDKSINILNNFLDGEDISSFTDAIVMLSSVACTNNKKIKVTGAVEPQMGLDGQSFLLQLFASDTNPPSQAKTLIFEYLMSGSEENNFELTFTPAVSTSFGQYISATATAQVKPPVHNWNTSEVSNALPACNSSGVAYSPFVCSEPDMPKIPFDCENCPVMFENDNALDIL